jgi:AcrR family transcriptional regulator
MSVVRIAYLLCNIAPMMLHRTGAADRLPRVSKPTPEDALRLARRRFLAPARVDLSALADELGVNRVTLYRWFGTRDGLLVETLWSLAERALTDAAAAEPDEAGAERVVGIVCRFLATVIDDPGMRRWLGEEGEHAMRLLTRHASGFQPRLIAAIEGLLCDEPVVELPVDPRELAFVVVRLIESYTYLDLLTGERPDAERARPILRMLFRLDAPVTVA